ncbi:hypothetical protein HCX49_07140 [Sphingobacterium kitahiroshimense]|uniref:nuclear transport factor 2 family protein n=1 Tax=Sphingobacterium sp. B16(2022) TaxID=2914044 RepID=UPI0014388490|nr:nuclear transport factor 2 family protein [Sphingobacterium sp. B16(2022)]NJI72975.1 hypothetical protein [Sphingobacterium sp. B16(2022)]
MMTTLVKTFAAVALVTLGSITMAADKPEKSMINLSTANLAIGQYIEIITEGQSIGLEQLFASDFNQKVQGTHAKTNSRSELINFFKKQKGERLNCKTTAQILETSKDYAIAKVIMQFDSFTKIDIVTLINDKGTWKITDSVTSYK